MNVQSINCQPIRPLQSKPSFTSGGEGVKPWSVNDDEFDVELNKIEKERNEWEKIAKNKDSKMLSALGTLGVSVMAGALSFCTFKTVAPKGYQTLKSIISTVFGNKLVKKGGAALLATAKMFGKKVKDIHAGIKPESKLGKVVSFVETKLGGIKKQVAPAFKKCVNYIKSFTEKHNINKQWVKTALKNTGATAVAIPAAVTAGNATDNMKGEA